MYTKTFPLHVLAQVNLVNIPPQEISFIATMENIEHMQTLESSMRNNSKNRNLMLRAHFAQNEISLHALEYNYKKLQELNGKH